MNSKISAIVITREMSANNTNPSICSSTQVRVYRGTGFNNDWAGETYDTNPHNVLYKHVMHGISSASVIRAKRAMLKLAEQAQDN